MITTPLSAAYNRARGDDGRCAAGVRRHRSPRRRSPPIASLPPSDRRRARFCRCTSTARPPTWPPSRRLRRRTALAIVGIAASAHSQHRREPSGRHHRHRRRVQLLSDEEPRRARRRRRDVTSETNRALADRLRRLRNGGQTDRYHHQEPGIIRAGRSAGRRPRARGLPGCAADRITARARGHDIEIGWRAAPSTCCPSATPSRLASVVVRPRARTDLQAHLGARIETLIHYFPCDPAAAGARPRSIPPSARWPRAPAARYFHCRSIPHCATTKSTRLRAVPASSRNGSLMTEGRHNASA